MADRAREGVGRVVGLGVVIEVQEAADHIGYLTLICSARPHNRLLNLHGGIFPHLDARKGTGNERSAARMCRGDGRADIRPEIDALDRRRMRLIPIDNRNEFVDDVPKARCEVGLGRRMDAPVGTAAAHTTALLHDAPAGIRQPGVDSQYDHRPSPQSALNTFARHARDFEHLF